MPNICIFQLVKCQDMLLLIVINDVNEVFLTFVLLSGHKKDITLGSRKLCMQICFFIPFNGSND